MPNVLLQEELALRVTHPLLLLLCVTHTIQKCWVAFCPLLLNASVLSAVFISAALFAVFLCPRSKHASENSKRCRRICTQYKTLLFRFSMNDRYSLLHAVPVFSLWFVWTLDALPHQASLTRTHESGKRRQRDASVKNTTYKTYT